MDSPKKSQPKQSLSPNKSFKTDDELMGKPDNEWSLSVSRGGRVRKAKVVFDPSEYKRRSMPNMEPPKPKRAAKPPTAINVEAAEEEKPDEPEANDSQEEESNSMPVATIAKRRKTISVAAFESGGCIVCFRSDIKKGRFVNCIGSGCKKRGHFTCLRNDKLFKTADSEKSWQCPGCKVCKTCLTAKASDQLYRCVLCHSSYHLHCIEPTPKYCTKKRFTCNVCSLTTLSMPAEKPTPPKPTPPKPSVGKKSAGFAGFSYDETNKSNGTKPIIEPMPSVTIIKKPPITIKRIQTDRSSTSSKSSIADPKPNIGDLLELEIKEEVHTPTSDCTTSENRASIYESLSNVVLRGPPRTDDRKNSAISVRTDLKQSQPEIKDTTATEPIEVTKVYDKASMIKPHENIPDCRNWDCDEVYTYFMGTTTAQYAELFKENEIDGDALLLMKRDDVLNRFNLKLGPALRLYAHIISLQYKNNNPVLTWNEY